MGTARRVWSVDTYVNAARPNTNYYGSNRLGLKKWDAADAQYAFINFPKPFNLGVQITEAKLYLTTYSMPEAGNHTINVALVKDQPGYSRMTWNTKPDVHGIHQTSVTKVGSLPGAQLWEIDVRAMMQSVSNGTVAWRGFRITIGDAEQRWLYSQETTLEGGDGPYLSLAWAGNPDEPQGMTPNEGVVGTAKPALSFDYIDVADNVTLSQAQIQTSPYSSFSTISWDSGVLDDVDKPVIYLSGTTYPGAEAGKRVYYRIKVADGAGLWSKRWSAPAWFIYKPNIEVVPTSFDPLDPRFADSTPDISWNVTGGVQKAYRVTVARNANPKHILWDTGKISGTTNVVAVPPKVMRWDDTNYRVVIRVWDKENRVSAANSLAYASSSHIVHLDEDGDSIPVDYPPTVEQVIALGGLMPFADVRWDREVSADAFEISRQDGDDDNAPKIIIGQTPYAESLQADGTHKFQDRTAPGNTRIRYTVRAVTNGKRSPGRPTEFFRLRTEGVWITTEDPQGTAEQMSLVINGSEQGTWNLPEEATAHVVRNSQTPVIIRELHRGYEGQIQGTVVEEGVYQPYLTGQEKRDRFFWFKKNLGIVRLIAGDVNIPVRLANMNIHPTPDFIQQYAVSFDFWQDGEVWWDVDTL